MTDLLAAVERAHTRAFAAWLRGEGTDGWLDLLDETYLPDLYETTEL